MIRKLPRKISKALKLPVDCMIDYENYKIFKVDRKHQNWIDLKIPEEIIKNMILKIQNGTI
jgi:hypothetical protein